MALKSLFRLIRKTLINIKHKYVLSESLECFAQVRKDSEYKQTEEDNAMSNLSHLDALEAEAIYIMREVAAE